MIKNLPSMWETWVRFLGWEDPLEEDMATHSSILVWRIPIDRGAWQAAVHGDHTESDMTEQLNDNRELHILRGQEEVYLEKPSTVLTAPSAAAASSS